MMLTDEVLADSVVVVAHFDDEVLWFSSLLSRVRGIVICFLDYPDWPKIKSGRVEVLRNFPLSNISCLGLSESKSFDLADWNNPQPIEYGLKLVKNTRADAFYRETFSHLISQLQEPLKGVKCVFTHNPWGEYGHERHVQVYRAVHELQKREGFRLFYSCYASNRSAPLMIEYLSGFQNQYCRMDTDVALAKRVANIYKANDCWTWYDDYQWFREEFFIEDSTEPQPTKNFGRLSPINLIRIDFGLNQQKGRLKLLRDILRSRK